MDKKFLLDYGYILFLQEDPTYLSFLEYPRFKEQKELTLVKLEDSTKTIFCHVKDYVDVDWAFIEALSRAKDLVTFLKQVLNEGMSITLTSPLPPLPSLPPPPIVLYYIIIDYKDLRNLIDAVETHSDQFIRESTVSDLIDVKSFFQGVLKKRLSGAEFLVMLHTSLTRDINLAAKVHSSPLAPSTKFFCFFFLFTCVNGDYLIYCLRCTFVTKTCVAWSACTPMLRTDPKSLKKSYPMH